MTTRFQHLRIVILFTMCTAINTATTVSAQSAGEETFREGPYTAHVLHFATFVSRPVEFSWINKGSGGSAHEVETAAWTTPDYEDSVPDDEANFANQDFLFRTIFTSILQKQFHVLSADLEWDSTVSVPGMRGFERIYGEGSASSSRRPQRSRAFRNSMHASDTILFWDIADSTRYYYSTDGRHVELLAAHYGVNDLLYFAVDPKLYHDERLSRLERRTSDAMSSNNPPPAFYDDFLKGGSFSPIFLR